MAWTTPGTAVAGEVLTAAFWNTNVRDNLIAGQPIFTNEAARDAAITAPFEGQVAYLTAPTIPAATSPGYTAIPTGINTVYNGSVWVCTTEVGAGEATADGDTTTTATYVTSLTGDSSVTTSVTLVTGTSAFIAFSCSVYGAPNIGPWTSISVSGATTLAASDDNGIVVDQPSAGAIQASIGVTRILTGLTAGTNTFTLNYRSGFAGSTATWTKRHLTVKGIA